MVPMVVVIVDGVVNEALICQDGEHLEEIFEEKVAEFGGSAEPADFDNGYIELDEATVCMTWANEA